MKKFNLIDYLQFQLMLMWSMEKSAPLQENLSAFMLSTMARLQVDFDAAIVIHAFSNSELDELHVLVMGTGEKSELIKKSELYRRHNKSFPGIMERSELPSYCRISVLRENELHNLVAPRGEVRKEKVTQEIKWLYEEISYQLPDEIQLSSISTDDYIILIPLCSGLYDRLGCFILWSKGDTLAPLVDNIGTREDMVYYGTIIERSVINLFKNFYQMEDITYLPSYYKINQKPVALLCAQIRGFDRISEILRHRRDFYNAEECLKKLISDFSNTVSEIVDQFKGRVDQIWGNGLLATFGEYLDYPVDDEEEAKEPCMRAVSAAAKLLIKFSTIADRWLKETFKIQEFKKIQSELIELGIGVAVDYGSVLFDYVGSSKYRVYMAVGDHVDFVKQLVSIAGITELEKKYYDIFQGISLPSSRDLLPILHDPSPTQSFLISQPVYTWAQHILNGVKGSSKESVFRVKAVLFPGKLTIYKVYELSPDYVETISEPNS